GEGKVEWSREGDHPAGPRGQGGRRGHGRRPPEAPRAAPRRAHRGARRGHPDLGREAGPEGRARDLARHLGWSTFVAMRCHRCRGAANVEIRRSRTAYCARCYPGWFREQVQERINHERMFRHDQRVLVAVSGGKDSLALWHVLTRLGYQADGMYIRLGIGDYSRRSQARSEAFAAKHGLTLHQVDLEHDQGFTVPDLLDIRSGKPCSACGTVKRYHFNKLAADLGYPVVATGHNLDDEAATLFGNVLHWNVDYLGRQ